MALLTDTQHAQLLAQGQRRADDPDFDPVPVAKLYLPDARAVWLLAAAYPDEPGRIHGLCDAGTGFPQRTDMHLHDLQGLRGPNGYPVAVDTHFVAQGPLSAYVARAVAQGAYTED